MTPMGSNLAEEDGFCGPRLEAYYAERAKGGAALITMGSVSIGYPEGSSNYRHEAISDDKYIPGLRCLADTIHSHGAKVCVQLHHAGLTAMNDMLAGRPIACPSIPEESKDEGDFGIVMLEDEAEKFFEPYTSMGEVTFDTLSVEAINRLVGMYASAADRAKRAGLDAVEIHAGHGYIISSFLSPHANRRTDEYGGGVENRSRLLVEVIKAIRDAVGPDYPVWARIDSEEFYLDGGIKLEDAKVTARLAQEAGLDAIHVSAHGDANRGITYSTGHATHVPGGFVSNAQAIKSVVDIPVIVPGRIEPKDADRLIGQGSFDFLTMGRKLLADPHLPRKLAEGREPDIRPCIYCYTCISNIFHGSHIICAVNHNTSREVENPEANSQTPSKNIAVIGGGPAGMEVSRLLAARGHRISLYEKGNRLGGTGRIASIAYEPNEGFIDWLIRQVRDSDDVDVHLNTEVTAELIKDRGFDHVVVAVGALRTMPEIPGNGQDFVFDGDEIRGMLLGEGSKGVSLPVRFLLWVAAGLGLTGQPKLVRALSRIWMPVPRKVVIIGGELVGIELAEFLAYRGRVVTIVEESSKLGRGIQLVRRFRALEEIQELGVQSFTGVSRLEIGQKSVSFHDENGQPVSVDAGQVIVAKGAIANTSLAGKLRAEGIDVSEIGDGTGVGYLNGAVADAAAVVKKI